MTFAHRTPRRSANGAGGSIRHAPAQGPRSRFARGLAVAACLTVAACSVGPAYRRPAAPLPDQWQTGTAGPAGWPTADWWQGFGSGTLDDYIHQALSGSDDIAAAVARVREAQDQAQVAGAPLYPAVGAQFTGEQTRTFVPPHARTKGLEAGKST